MLEKHTNEFIPLTIQEKEQWIIDLYTSGNGERRITVEQGAGLNYLVLCEETATVDIHIECREKSHATIFCLCVGTPEANISLTAHAHLAGNEASSDMHILSLLRSGSSCNVDGGVIIPKGVAEVSGDLIEEIVILEPKVSIKTLPRLDVQSSNVAASHGAKIHTLDSKKLFYLTAKGLTLSQAKHLLISGHLESMFERFIEKDESLKERKTSYLKQLTSSSS